MARRKKPLTVQDQRVLGEVRAIAGMIVKAGQERVALVRQLRAAGISPEDIAEAAGMSVGWVYKVPRTNGSLDT